MDEENQKSSNSAKSTNETKQHRSPKLKTTSAMGRRFVSLDWAMKKILRDKANFCVLEGFLSELLGEEVTIEEILESESNRQHARDKQNRVDIKVRRGEDQIILVELQFQRDLDFFHRILFGVSKAVTEHLESGSRYREVNKVISVNIVYFDPGVGDDYIYRGTTTFHGVHTNSKLELAETFQDYLRVQRVFQIFPEYYLLCVPRFQGRPKDTLDQWLYFLKTEEIEQDFSARGIQQAKQILHVANLSTPQRRAYEEFEDQARCLAGEAAQHKWEVERAQEKGLKEGREQGRAEERRELARVMLESGLSREEVLRITGVDLE